MGSQSYIPLVCSDYQSTDTTAHALANLQEGSSHAEPLGLSKQRANCLTHNNSHIYGLKTHSRAVQKTNVGAQQEAVLRTHVHPWGPYPQAHRLAHYGAN